MSRIQPALWGALAHVTAGSTALRARPAIPGHPGRLLAALDGRGGRHFLVRIGDDVQDYSDHRSRGIGVSTESLAVHDEPPGRYLKISCLDMAGAEAFDLVGGDLAAALVKHEDRVVDAVHDVLARWRLFWRSAQRAPLTEAEQTGVFGELWFLAFWLMPRFGADNSLAGWRGPDSARHDFEWPGLSVEVKATHSTRGPVHRINGLDQLVAPESGQLLLFSMQLRVERGARNSLPGLVRHCRELLAASAEAAETFERQLAKLGFNDSHESEYGERHLRVASEGLYGVRADFPRLTPDSFPEGLPQGVERIDYEINLTSSRHLLIATQPAEHEAF